MVSPATGERFCSADKLFISGLTPKCVLAFFVAAAGGEDCRAPAAVNTTHTAV